MQKCVKCGREIDLAKNMLSRLIERKGICLLCWNAIAGKEYEYTPGQKVYFAPPPPDSIGDRFICDYIVNEFNKDTGASARIVWAEDMKLLWDPEALVFWNIQVNSFMRPNNHKVIDIYPPREAHYLAKQGRKFYISEKTEPINIELPEKFIVLHLRNIQREEKTKDKDMKKNHAAQIISVIRDSKVPCFLIGNDHDFRLDLGEINDLRWKLSLGQIRWLMERAYLTTGKDSGPLHIAAGASQYILGYGYVDECWFPMLTPEEKGYFFMYDQSFQPYLKKLNEIVQFA